MLFGGKRKVEEDLEKIRRANLPTNSDHDEPHDSNPKLDGEKKVETLRFKDVFAIILALLSLVMPYFLVFAALLLGIWLLVRFLAG